MSKSAPASKSKLRQPFRHGNHNAAAVLGVAAVAALGLSACGSSSASNSQQSSKNLVSVSIATFYPANATAMPIYLADLDGFFAKNGVAVTQVHVADGTAASQALLSGSVDMADESAFQVLPAISQGEPVQLIGELESQENTELVVSSKLNLHSGYPSVFTELKGKVIGVSSLGGAEYYQVRYILASVGLTPGKNVTLVAIGGSLTGAFAALSAGKLDAFVSNYPQTGQFVATGQAKVGFDFWGGSRPPLLVNLMDAGIAAKKTYISSHASAVKDVHNALTEAIHVLNGLTSATAPNVAKILAPDFAGIPQAQVVNMLLSYKNVYQSYITPTNISNTNALLLQAKAIKAAVPFSQAVASIGTKK